MNNLSQDQIIDTDVSRDWLDFHCLRDGHQLRLPNTGEGYVKLSEFARRRNAHVCFEATGGHEWWLSTALYKAESRPSSGMFGLLFQHIMAVSTQPRMSPLSLLQ